MSIIDLATGLQLLDNEDHAASVVFNGEIWYNAYLESLVRVYTLH